MVRMSTRRGSALPRSAPRTSSPQRFRPLPASTTARTRKIVWSNKEQFSGWSGALATAGGLVFYGTLEGYLKAVDARTGKELYKFKTGSGIIGNPMTYEHRGKQYIAVMSGVGGWAGIGLAAGVTDPTAGLRA